MADGEEGEEVPPEPRITPPARLDAVRELLSAKGHSAKAIKRISHPTRTSTDEVYTARWGIWTEWCGKHDVDSCYPTEPALAEFFLHLFEEKGLALETLKGYRAAIQSALWAGGIDISKSMDLHNLFRNLALERPRKTVLPPQWNLPLALYSLLKDPYEPMGRASFEAVSKKTLFLLALATGRRRSELHALSHAPECLNFWRGHSGVTLLTMPGFMAKNQPADMPSPKIEVPALSTKVGRDDEERLLCPIRALRYYLEAAGPRRKGRKRLFIPIEEKASGEIRPGHVTSWIQDVVHQAYISAGEEDHKRADVRAHETRSIATSWRAFNRSCSMEDIMRAAFWRSDSTFTGFYLRDMCGQARDLYSLGPLVMAQAVVEPPAEEC